jgi:hypothetical protein
MAIVIACEEMLAINPPSAELLERLAFRHGILLAQPAPHDEQICRQALREPEGVDRILLHRLRLDRWDIRLLARWFLAFALVFSFGLLFFG